MRRYLLSILAFLLISGGHCHAQIYSSGNDQGSLKWKSFRTEDFKLIYPEGMDSLARVYGVRLEQYKEAVGKSIGAYPNERYRRPLHITLHGQTAIANGSVNWVPHSMDLYTVQDAYAADVLPWVDILAIHEQRHVAQLQLVRSHGFGVFRWLSGDLFGGAVSALYPSDWFLEGDAVVAETGLTKAGRGRSADFLEYYRAAFDEGDYRDWFRWRYGSKKYFTPDHYKIGYLTIGGARYLYDSPDFSALYSENVHGKHFPFGVNALGKTFKQVSGKKFKVAWDEITAAQDSIWKEDMASRGSFNEAERLTAEPRRFTQYTGTTMLGDRLFSIRNGMSSAGKLVSIDNDGTVRVLRPFASSTSDLMASPADGRIYWSEAVPDMRWTLKGSSRIRYIEEGSIAIKTLTKEGRLFNPAPSPDGGRLAVTSYPMQGGSEIVILDSFDGTELEHFKAPDHIQVVESAWIDGRVIASGLSSEGFGIYDVSGGFTAMLAPQQAKIRQLRSVDGHPVFISDRLGVNELYMLDGDKVVQLSSNRLGASDFVICSDSLYFSALTKSDRGIYKAALSPVGETDYSRLTAHPIAEKLSEQEAALGAVPMASEPTMTAPERYGKLSHLLRLHSWLPVYVDYDEISDFSMETLISDGMIGATAFFQNDLGTAYGTIGYLYSKYQPDALTLPEWRSSLHARMTYTGRYPVLKLSADIGERNPYQYGLESFRVTNTKYTSLNSRYLQGPSVLLNAKIYIPFNFSSGGWQRGVIPQVNATLSNDFINTSVVNSQYAQVIGEKSGGATFFSDITPGSIIQMGRVAATLRAYTMQNIAGSCIYPRWGVGSEVGYSVRPSLGDTFTPDFFMSLYGYVPGLVDTHGIRLAMLTQHQFKAMFSDQYTRVLPKGIMPTSTLNKYISSRYPVQTKFSVNYSLPLVNLDWAGLRRLAYMKNIDLRSHFEYAVYNGSESFKPAALFSAGGELCVNLGNFAWVPYDTRIGVSYSFNGGPSWADMTKNGADLQRHHLEFVFSVDL